MHAEDIRYLSTVSRQEISEAVRLSFDEPLPRTKPRAGLLCGFGSSHPDVCVPWPVTPQRSRIASGSKRNALPHDPLCARCIWPGPTSSPWSGEPNVKILENVLGSFAATGSLARFQSGHLLLRHRQQGRQGRTAQGGQPRKCLCQDFGLMCPSRSIGSINGPTLTAIERVQLDIVYIRDMAGTNHADAVLGIGDLATHLRQAVRLISRKSGHVLSQFRQAWLACYSYLLLVKADADGAFEADFKTDLQCAAAGVHVICVPLEVHWWIGSVKQRNAILLTIVEKMIDENVVINGEASATKGRSSYRSGFRAVTLVPRRYLPRRQSSHCF